MNNPQANSWKRKSLLKISRNIRSRIQELLIFLTVWLVANPLMADPIRELLKLTPSRSTPGDGFGSRVDISGDTAIVSATGDNEFGENAGAAYLFDANNGAELFRLTASDAETQQYFGSSVAISGNLAIVGASGDSGFAGAAYVFDVTTGEEMYKLTHGIPGEAFGFSVGIHGLTAIVGTGFFEDAAYVFDLSTGERSFDLAPTDRHLPPNGNNGFGLQVDLSGNKAVVAAYGESEFGDNAGAVYVYDVTTGDILRKLSASDAGENQFFGGGHPDGVAIEGDKFIAGAVHSNNSDRGKAHFFHLEQLNEVFLLDTPRDDQDNLFANGVAISGNNIILTASVDTVEGKPQAGSGYLFNAASLELFKFFPADGEPGDNFGTSVAIDDNMLVIGTSPSDVNDRQNTKPGAAYIFQVVNADTGDVNQDGTVDVGDIDDLAKAIRDEMNNAAFDLDDDGLVTSADHKYLVTEILNTWIGDANLNGEFNTTDFVRVFQQGQYEDEIVGNSTWATGDWNGDGDFTTVDLIVAFQDGGFERGPRVVVNAVPEPTSFLLLTGVSQFVLAATRRRMRRKSISRR